MTLRAVTYARVSSDAQREKHTIASQRSELPGYVKAGGWRLVEACEDDGISGETVEARPGFLRVLELAEARAFDVLVVIDLDRITRAKKSAEAALIFDTFRECGIKLCVRGQPLVDMEDEDQDFFIGLRREVAKWEKRKILRRLARGKREAIRQGRRYGCRDPYGYRWAPDEALASRGTYVLHEPEAAVVRRAVELALSGLGIAFIVEALNAEGLRTRPFKKHPKGAPWQYSSLRKLLRSTTIRGEFQILLKTETRAMKLPAIVDAETWVRLQHALDARRVVTRRKLQGEYLLAGIAKCGVCGLAMWVQPGGRGHGQRSYYRCSSTNAWRKMGLKGPCGQRHHDTAVVDAEVWAEVARVLASPRLLAEACSLAATGGAEAGVDWKAQRAAFARRLRELEALEAEVLGRRRRGLLSAAACDRELDTLARERRTVERNLALAEKQMTTASDGRERLRELEELSGTLAGRLAGATFAQRLTLVRAFLPPGVGAVRLAKNGDAQIQGLVALGGEELTLEMQVRRSG